MTATTVYSFQPTIPAGTTQATPFKQALTFPVFQVDKIEWRVPPGPLGNMGFYLASLGQQIIPFQAGQWIIANDEAKEWNLADLMTSGAWQFVGYNLGQWAHSVYLTFHVEPVPTTNVPTSVLSPAVTTLASP